MKRSKFLDRRIIWYAFMEGMPYAYDLWVL